MRGIYFLFSNVRLLDFIRVHDEVLYNSYFRMSAKEFDYFLQKVTLLLEIQNVFFGEPVSVKEKLATGNSYEDLKFSFGISPQKLGRFITEICRVIYTALKQECFKVN